MSLWVDKYRPTSLAKLDYHKEQAEQLKRMVSVVETQQGKDYACTSHHRDLGLPRCIPLLPLNCMLNKT